MPQSVLQQMADEMLDFRGTGMSIGEISHRSQVFVDVISAAEKDLRTLLSVPDNYKVLFMAGGGTGQFAAVALNLFHSSDGPACTYVVSGAWSKAAAVEASKFCTLTETAEWETFSSARTKFVYACTNETVNGILHDPVDDLGDAKQHILIADMSSELLTRTIDVSKYGLIFAGAQKNIGIAGVTVVIVRDDLLGSPSKQCPIILDYTVTAKNGSLYNTPPVTAIYTASLVFKWALAQGGLRGLEQMALKKSSLLYEALDRNSAVFSVPVPKQHRSRTNVVFRCVDEANEKKFISMAEKKGMVGLTGHRSVGGIRASLYNAVPLEHVEELVRLIDSFSVQAQKGAEQD